MGADFAGPTKLPRNEPFTISLVRLVQALGALDSMVLAVFNSAWWSSSSVLSPTLVPVLGDPALRRPWLALRPTRG